MTIMIPLMEEILHHLGYINLVNNGINYISTGAGFLPSTVVIVLTMKILIRIMIKGF